MSNISSHQVKSQSILPSLGFWLVIAAQLFLNVLIVGKSSANAEIGDRESECLYVIIVGDEKKSVLPCYGTDKENLSENATLFKVTRMLGIKSEEIKYSGCKEHYFSAKPLFHQIKQHKYEITYIIGDGISYIPPITHELAHVLQFEIYGGLGQLKDNLSSLRIELAADYLTGVIFQRLDIDKNEFQHSVELIGRFHEDAFNAHGSPSQRNAAFRYGYFDSKKELDRDIRYFHEKFQNNIYGLIIVLK